MSMEDRDGYVWFDGELIPWRDARPHVLSYTFQHGAGVFEGVRAYATKKGAAIFRLRDHTDRLVASAKILQMPLALSKGEIDEAHIAAVRANNLGQCYIRANVIYDGQVPGVSAEGNLVHVYVSAWEWNAYLGAQAQRDGIRIKTASFARLHVNSALRKAKANGHYINSMLAVQEAKRDGYNDALMLDAQGFVAECSTSNVFVVRRGAISTPDRATILEGITRDTAIILATERGIAVTECRLTRDDLYCADEVFVTGTAAEIVPVVEYDGHQIGTGSPGSITTALQGAYADAVSGRDTNHLEWLTPL